MKSEGWKRRHRKIWKLNVGDDDKNEEIKWKLSGFLGDKNFNSKILVEFPVAFTGEKHIVKDSSQTKQQLIFMICVVKVCLTFSF